jgi:hypothetical protein
MLEALMGLLADIYNSGKDESSRVLYMVTSHFKKLNIRNQQTAKARSNSDTFTINSWPKLARRESLSINQEK